MAESTIGPITPNKYGNALATLLRKGKGAVDAVTPTFQYKDNPRFTAGDLLFGEAPEAMDAWAHGFPPWKGKGQTWTLEPEAIDIAAMPTFGVGGAAMTVGKRVPKTLSKAVGRELVDDVPDMGRRDFLKKAGVAGTVAAMPSLLVKSLAKDVPAAVAKAVPRMMTKADAPLVFREMGRVYKGGLQRNIENLTKDPNINGNSYYRGYLSNLRKEYDANPTNFYTDAQREKMEALIDRMPPEMTPREFMYRFGSAQGEDMFPGMPRELLEKEGLSWDFDIGEGLVNSNLSTKEITAKADEAYEALKKVDPTDLDVWIITGKPPPKFEKYVDWTNPDDVYVHSNSFGYDADKTLSIESLLEQSMYRSRYGE
jgi:hypothetical protein